MPISSKKINLFLNLSVVAVLFIFWLLHTHAVAVLVRASEAGGAESVFVPPGKIFFRGPAIGIIYCMKLIIAIDKRDAGRAYNLRLPSYRYLV